MSSDVAQVTKMDAANSWGHRGLTLLGGPQKALSPTHELACYPRLPSLRARAGLENFLDLTFQLVTLVLQTLLATAWRLTNRWLGLPGSMISRQEPGFDPSERYGVGTASS